MSRYSKYQDRELLSLIAGNDTSAFTELYDRYWKPLFTIAYNRLKEKESAEDAVHDVLMGIWAHRDQVQVETPAHYLAVSIKYSVLTRIRKKLREKQWLKEWKPEANADPGPESALYHKQILERLKTEVEHLPTQCRLIFKCSREAGLPVKTIARQLQLSPKTVENQLTKALKHLKIAARSFLHAGLTWLIVMH